MNESIHKREIEYSADEGNPWEEGNKDKEVYQATPKEVKVKIPGEFLYGKTLNWYFEVLIWPMFILILLEIGARVMQTKYFFNINPQIFEWLICFTRAFLFAYLAVLAAKHYSASKKQILTVTTAGGILVGIVLAVFQLFWYFELWTFFNLLGQPLLLGLEGLIISWLIAIVFKRRLKI